MLIALIVVEVIVMCIVPVALALVLRKRFGTPWMVLVAGAIAFVASQVVHLPLNAGISALFRSGYLAPPPEVWQLAFNAVVGGLTAGLCEEVARYLVLRFWAVEVRFWRQALAFGAGHGGIESILTGALVGVTLANMTVLRRTGVETLGLPAEQAAQVAEAVTAFWETAWYLPLLATFERLMAILLHLALAAMVVRSVAARRLWLLGAAIAWHTLVNAVAVYAQGRWGPLAAEGVVLVLSVASAAILWAVWRTEQREALTGR